MNATKIATEAAGPEHENGAAAKQTRARGPALMHRLMMIHELLVSGASPEEALAQAQLKWGISRRSALDYLYRVRKRLTETGYREDRVYVQQMGLTQRGRVLGKVMSFLRELDPTEAMSAPVVTQLASMAAKLIDARDRAAIEADTLKPEAAAPAAQPSRITHTSRTTRAIVMTTHTHAGQELLDQSVVAQPLGQASAEQVALGTESKAPDPAPAGVDYCV